MSNDRIHSFSHLDDFLEAKDEFKSWAEKGEIVIIENGLSLRPLSIGFLSAQKLIHNSPHLFIDKFRDSVENTVLLAYKSFLEDCVNKEFSRIVQDFFANAGIIVFSLSSSPSYTYDLDFLIYFLRNNYENGPYCSFGTISPTEQLISQCEGRRYRDISYPAGTIPWRSVVVKPDVIKAFTPEENIRYDSFVAAINQLIPSSTPCPTTPFISIDEVTYYRSILPVIIAVRINAGALICVPNVAKERLIADLDAFKKGSALELRGFDLIFEWQKQAMSAWETIPKDKTAKKISSCVIYNHLSELCGDKDAASSTSNAAVQSSHSVNANDASTLGKDKNSEPVIQVYFDKFDGTYLHYRVNNVTTKTNRMESPVRFLAFIAGAQNKPEKYSFTFNDTKDAKKVFLIKDKTDYKELTKLFEKKDSPIANITDSIPASFWQFVKHIKDQNFKKEDLAQQLFKMNRKHYPPSAYCVNSNWQTDLMDKINETPINSASSRTSVMIKLTDKNKTPRKDVLAKVELKDNIKFKIALSSDFTDALTTFAEGKNSDEYTAIIKFIIETFPPVSTDLECPNPADLVCPDSVNHVYPDFTVRQRLLWL